MAYRIKWEALVDRNVRKQLASSMATKFRQLPEVYENIKTKWLLFRTAMILSTGESCGRKSGIEWRWIVRKEHLGGTKMLKKLSEQKKEGYAKGLKRKC